MENKTFKMAEKIAELVHQAVMTSFAVIVKVSAIIEEPTDTMVDFYCDMLRDINNDYKKFCKEQEKKDKDDEEKLDIE